MNPSGVGEGRMTLPYDKLNNVSPFLGIIPRRGFGNNNRSYASSGFNSTSPFALASYAYGSPLKLLMDFIDSDPVLSLALWQALRLSFPADGIEFKGMEFDKPEKSNEYDEDATMIIEQFFAQLPSEVGGLNGLLCTLMIQALCTGLITLEAVPGMSGEGVRRVWAVDSLSIWFGRKNIDDDLTPYQLQFGLQAGTAGTKGATFGYKELSINQFFWTAIDPLVDQPEGRAPYAPAIVEILKKLVRYNDLEEAIHQVAYGRIKIGFNFSAALEQAVNILGIRDPEEAAAWVMSQFNAIKEQSKTFKADDVILTDTNGTADMIEGSSALGNIVELKKFLRQDLVMAVKSLPTLLGINDGATQTYTSVEWRIYAEGLESLRHMIMELVKKALNLHFRLLGESFKAVPVYDKIRTSDDQIEANTEAVRIQNEIAKRNEGWIDNDQAAMAITGSEAVSDPDDDDDDQPQLDPLKQETQDGKEAAPELKAKRAYELKAKVAEVWRSRRAEFERGLIYA